MQRRRIWECDTLARDRSYKQAHTIALPLNDIDMLGRRVPRIVTPTSQARRYQCTSRDLEGSNLTLD